MMMDMKKMHTWGFPLSCIAALLLLSGCYESYIKDYDQSAVYTAYQWDLRSFVVGEDQAFKFTVALAGVMQNRQDRAVKVSVDNALVTAPGTVAGLSGESGIGAVSGDYVGAALAEAGVTALTPLPSAYYTLEGLQGLTIAKGAHTATVTIRATDALIADPAAYEPGYAIAFRIESADADFIPEEKNFAVIAVRCENRFYGYYTRSAHVKKLDVGGNVLSETDVAASTADDFVYCLTTVDGRTVRSDKVAGEAGEMLLTFDGNDGITVSSPDGSVSGTGQFNGALLLQARELRLQYSVTQPDGGRLEVSDILVFRNRIRDGVNEWQDEHPEHYPATYIE